MIAKNLVKPKAAVKLELLFNKIHTSDDTLETKAAAVTAG
jgi:hypothetical protein